MRINPSHFFCKWVDQIDKKFLLVLFNKTWSFSLLRIHLQLFFK